ncbi:MAG: winged helix DNA-binding protein [Candidatus Woesearchaeota archaeon]
MKEKKEKTSLLILYSLFLLLLPSTSAAIIRGAIYDLDLNLAPNAIIKVNSTPEQIFVATEGNYSIYLPSGNYTLTAYYKENDELYIAQRELMITAEGDYIYDLILFPDFGFEKNISDIDLNIADIQFNNKSNDTFLISWKHIIIFVFFFFLLVIIFWSTKSSNKSSEHDIIKRIQISTKKNIRRGYAITDDTLKEDNIIETGVVEKDISEQILEFLKKEDGRANQKDIRKNFPVSEAKISLVIKELEAKGLVQKIKKGKGNIIILIKNISKY